MVGAVMLRARGKRILFSKHAAQALWNEWPAIDPWDVTYVLENPDEDTPQNGARRRLGGRTIIVRYQETEEAIHVRTVSATRSR